MSSVFSPTWWQKKWRMWDQLSCAHFEVIEDEVKMGNWRAKKSVIPALVGLHSSLPYSCSQSCKSSPHSPSARTWLALVHLDQLRELPAAVHLAVTSGCEASMGAYGPLEEWEEGM